jgi:uncharacterized iron-regulated protein
MQNRQLARFGFGFFSLFLLAAGGCATSQSAAKDDSNKVKTEAPAVTPGVKLSMDDFQKTGDRVAYLDGKSGEVLSEAEMMNRVSNQDFVLVGESHDQASHHRLQVQVLEHLISQSRAGGQEAARPVIVALEMVPWTRQEVLDAYGRSEIDEQGLLAGLDWEKTWGYDFEMYAEIFRHAKDSGARLLAINAPRTLVRSLARNGLENLSPEEQGQLPEMDLTNETHKSSIKEVFDHHHPPTGAGKAFERFYAAQVLWDETMAEKSVNAFNDSKSVRPVVLVIAGNGHVGSYAGIPDRIQRRLPNARIITVVPILLEDEQSADSIASEAVEARIGDLLMIEIPPIRLEM